MFFDGVQARVASGVKISEVSYQLAFSKQELRKVISQYPGSAVSFAKTVILKIILYGKSPLTYAIQNRRFPISNLPKFEVNQIYNYKLSYLRTLLLVTSNIYCSYSFLMHVTFYFYMFTFWEFNNTKGSLKQDFANSFLLFVFY